MLCRQLPVYSKYKFCFLKLIFSNIFDPQLNPQTQKPQIGRANCVLLLILVRGVNKALNLARLKTANSAWSLSFSENLFPELNSTSFGHGAHWEISSDPWNSLIFHHSWVLVTSPCHKIILWSLPLPSFFALQIRWSNYAAHLMTEPLRSACYHIISGIFRSSFNFGLCFKTISLFDLLQSLSYSQTELLCLVGTSLFLPQAPCYSLQPWLPLVAKLLHTLMPHVASGVGYTFSVCFWLHPFYPVLLPLPGEIGTPEQIKPGIFLSFPTQTYNGLY